MGIGIVIIGWLIALSILSIFYAIVRYFFGKKNLWTTFNNTLVTLIIFICLFVGLSHLIGNFIPGKKHGGFGDSWFIEVKNGYMLEYIDNLDNAVLTDGNEIIATNRGSFGEVLFIALHNNFILLEDSKYRDKLTIIDTINKTKKEIKKPWQLEDGVEIEHKDLKSMINFY